jgi:hypothetical protein
MMFELFRICVALNKSYEIILYYKIIENDMKNYTLVILILPLLIVGLPNVFAQSNNTNITNSTGGLSSESVGAAISNSTSSPANLIVNSSSPGEDTQNSTGGLSSESVTESKY